MLYSVTANFGSSQKQPRAPSNVTADLQKKTVYWVYIYFWHCNRNALSCSVPSRKSAEIVEKLSKPSPLLARENTNSVTPKFHL